MKSHRPLWLFPVLAVLFAIPLGSYTLLLLAVVWVIVFCVAMVFTNHRSS